MNCVKFSVFADLHYRDGDWNWASQRLEAILRRAETEHVDFIMHCGDFCHNIVTATPIIDRYNRFPIPAFHTLGNHDFEETDGLQIVLDAYRMKKNYYSFDLNGIRMISLDTNYYLKAGNPAHFADSDFYTKCHQGEMILPPEELEFLHDAVVNAPGPCVIFSHASAIRADGLSNRLAVRQLLASARNGRPVLWINGHYHRNNLQLCDNIAWFDLNSTTSDWVTVPHHAYPPELMGKFECSEHELLFTEPVHALVTVNEDGEIRIDGMEGGMYQGITREMTGNSAFDSAGLPCDASVLSAHFRLLDQPSGNQCV